MQEVIMADGNIFKSKNILGRMISHNEIEENILEFWQKSKTFEKSLERPAGKKPKGKYIFYDGPPFITGLPHYGSILPSIIKDCIPRFWTMKGFRVERVWGWDCHGLPAENRVESELKLKNKKDIENMGIGKFVCACKDYVSNVSGQWKWYIDRIARWVDFDNSYKTSDINFMESVIWSFKQLYEKGFIYEDYRCSLHCPRCATPLSKFEITMDAGSYKDVTEQSIVVKFKLTGKTEFKDSYILAWTTTPWTLPGNLALAINENIGYVLVEHESNRYILAEAKLNEIFKNKKYKLIKKLDSKDLIGLEYFPLFDLQNQEIFKNKNNYKVYSAEFISTEEGSGVVHIAPNFGEEDFELGKKLNLSILDIMDENGIYTENLKEWGGLYFRDAAKEVMKKLGDKLFDKFNYTHSYPFCYRCQAPLIYRAQKSWYLKTEKIRKRMINTNENINWVPGFFKHGRFKHNLESAPSWCISRSRYWGTPIPIWRCENCDKIKVVGSIKEIEDLSRKKVKDLHKPDIDNHFFKCKCGGKMTRIPEIFDCWFESGTMPFAQWHYPFEQKNNFKKIFPADFITEYTGQLRGWFYYLHVISNSLFDLECFKNVIVTGVLSGTDGRKMSKLFGNYPDPKLTLEKYGGDALRMYFLSSPIVIGGDMNLNEREMQDSLRKNVLLAYNSYNFYETSVIKDLVIKGSENVMDQWIISRLNQLIKEVTKFMEKYDIPSASRLITEFIEDLSTWYLRQNRDRLNDQNPEALSTTKKVFETFSKVLAPFMPYSAEHIWQNISKNCFKDSNKSVHLESWPTFSEKLIDLKLIDEMKFIREIVSLGLAERDKAKIGLKWPLEKAIITTDKKISNDFISIIISELNLKEIRILKGEKLCVELDLNITPELESEGFVRELLRIIQAERKNVGLVKQDVIELEIVSEELKNMIKGYETLIKEKVNAKTIFFSNSNNKFNYFKSGKIKQIYFDIKFNKV